jgi:hypothetical protein
VSKYITWSDGWVAEQNAKEQETENKRNKVEYYLIWIHEKTEKLRSRKENDEVGRYI